MEGCQRCKYRCSGKKHYRTSACFKAEEDKAKKEAKIKRDRQLREQRIAEKEAKIKRDREQKKAEREKA